MGIIAAAAAARQGKASSMAGGRHEEQSMCELCTSVWLPCGGAKV